jgi:hypothetical protein
MSVTFTYTVTAYRNKRQPIMLAGTMTITAASYPAAVGKAHEQITYWNKLTEPMIATRRDWFYELGEPLT